MPNIWEFLPDELRERLEEAPSPGVVLASPIFIDNGDRRRAEDNRRAWAAHTEARRAVEVWAAGALSDGTIVARGVEPGAEVTAQPVTIPREQWRRLRYDLRSNVALCAATRQVVLTGLDFERPPLPEPGATAAAPAITPERLAKAMVAAKVSVGRDPFRAICRELYPGETIEVMDSVQSKIFGRQPAGRKKKPA